MQLTDFSYKDFTVSYRHALERLRVRLNIILLLLLLLMLILLLLLLHPLKQKII